MNTLRKYGAKYNVTFCTFAGLSTDTKPVGTTLIDNKSVALANGSEFIEMDTDKKYAYDAENQQWNLASSGGGGGGSATLIEKSITENGEYNASADNADGYSKVTVNVAGGGGETFEVILNTSDGATFTPSKTFAETVAAMQNQTPVTMKMRLENGGQTLEQVASFFYNALEPESINAIYILGYFPGSSMNGFIWNENGFGTSTFHASITQT